MVAIQRKNYLYRRRIRLQNGIQDSLCTGLWCASNQKESFFVGSKIGKFEFPKPTHHEEEYVSCEAAIGDLPDLKDNIGLEESEYKKPNTKYQEIMRQGSKKLFNHVGTIHQNMS